MKKKNCYADGGLIPGQDLRHGGRLPWKAINGEREGEGGVCKV